MAAKKRRTPKSVNPTQRKRLSLARATGLPKKQRSIQQNRTIIQTKTMDYSVPRITLTVERGSPGKPAKNTITTKQTSGAGLPTSPPSMGPEPRNGKLQPLERAAEFWEGASLAFRVMESVDLLASKIEPDNVFEKFGWIYDISRILSTARSSLQYTGEQEVSKVQVQTLQDLLKQFKASNLEALKQSLRELNTGGPSVSLTEETFVEWHNSILDILQLSEAYAKEESFEDLWYTISDTTLNSYYDMVVDLDPAKIHSLSKLSAASIKRSISLSSMRSSEPQLHLIELRPDSDAAEVNGFVEEVITFYKRWSAKDVLEAPIRLFDDIQLVQARMGRLLSMRGQLTLKETLIDSDNDLRLIEWGRRFAYLWKDAIHTALNGLFQPAAKAVDGTSIVRFDSFFIRNMGEEFFTKYAALLRVLAPPAPEGVVSDIWKHYVPTMADSSLMMAALVRLGHLHATYQERTYFKNEKSLLWLLIWRSMKSVYFLLRASNGQFPTDTDPVFADRYIVDKAFFTCEKTRVEFQNIVQDVEANHPREIENLVGRYCAHVSACSNTSDTHYMQLAMLDVETKIKVAAQKQARDFHHRPTWDAKNHAILHSMTMKLNYLTRGLNTLRRWGNTDFNGDYAVWVNSMEDTIDPDAFLISQQITQTVGNTEQESLDQQIKNVGDSANNPTKVDHTLPASGPEKNTEPFLDTEATREPQDDNQGTVPPGRNPSEIALEHRSLPSHFPYVHYPFPETRANEVVQSRQITREMATGDILSDGPRVTDIINLPPRQARPSPIPRSAGWSPMGFVGNTIRFLSAVRTMQSAERMAQASQRPQSTRPIPDTSTILRPRRDQANRVSKKSRRPRKGPTPAQFLARSLEVQNQAFVANPETNSPQKLMNETSARLSPARQSSSSNGAGTSLSGNWRAPRGGLGNGSPILIYEGSASPLRDSSSEASSIITPTPNPQRRDPLEERDQVLAETPLPTIESPAFPQQAPVGPCHPCPQFLGSYHHLCAGVQCPGQGQRLAPSRTIRDTTGNTSTGNSPDPDQENLPLGSSSEFGGVGPITQLEQVHTDPTGVTDAEDNRRRERGASNNTVEDIVNGSVRDAATQTEPPMGTVRLGMLNTFRGLPTYGPVHERAIASLMRLHNGQPEPEVPPPAGSPPRRTPATYAQAGTQTAPVAPAPAPAPVATPPTQAEYGRMLATELRAELRFRNIPTAGLGTANAGLIAALIAADVTGNWGRGAYCLRNLTIASGLEDPGKGTTSTKKKR